MVPVAGGLELDIDRGPNWLFIRLQPSKQPTPEAPNVADELWSISNKHFIYRLVLELDQLESLPPGIMGQLVMLHERLTGQGGSLRVCGLSPECEEKFHACHLDDSLPNHTSREDAVLGESTFATSYELASG